MGRTKTGEGEEGSLEMQKELCDEGMALVNAGVALQNAGDADGAERDFARAVELMERALALTYASPDDQEAASRLNNKMSRYIKMIKSQRAKAGTTVTTKRVTGKCNVLEMDALPARYQPIAQLFASSPAYGNIFETLQQTFGFQDGSVANQREHLMLLLANFKEYVDESNVKDAASSVKDAQADMELLLKAIDKFHTRLFTNYTKWAKYLGQKPKFTKEPLADIVLFFLIWGEAGNFRQTPELLCFVFYSLAPSVVGANTANAQEPGYFLSHIIRPMYVEVKKDNDKKTPMGVRAPHTEIRNYDDFNEFFWTKKCLKYDAVSIAEAFGAVNKAGNPSIVKKTFMERRSWLRALLSFRRIFVSHFVLFLATLAFALNMVLVCPVSPIMYGEDLGTTVQFFGRLYYKPNPSFSSNDDATTEFVTRGCNLPKLATCLGVPNYNPGVTFEYLPEDFKMLLNDVPFTNCLQLTTGQCSCYLDLLDLCFGQTGTGLMVNTDVAGNRKTVSVTYDQSKCMPKYKKAALNVINTSGNGKLNCQACRLEASNLMSSLPYLIPQFLDFGRSDKGPLVMLGGAGCVGLLMVWELQNRLFSGIGIGFVGRSMPVPCGAYCRYFCFWVLLFAVKLMFDYQFMVKSLVETTLFIWLSDPTQYLQVSHFMLQISYHNVIYIFFLWMPAIIVFLYDAQIFYAILSVVFGSVRGFTLRIGELRSFRILRLTFKSIPKVFNKKIVSNLIEAAAKKKKKAKKGDKTDDDAAPERHFLPISYDDGSKPLTVKTQAYSSLLEHGHDISDNYTEMSTPHDSDASPTQSARSSVSDAVAGVTGPAFERAIPFAMAWNRCLASMRDEDVLSNRELSVLSYLIDSKAAAERRLYAPVFLTAGKLDESLDIATECYAVYDQLKTDKKKEKALQKMEAAMTERLVKDDLRVQAILGSYKFASQIIKLLLGDEHRELDGCFNFIEESVFQHTTLKALNLSVLYHCKTSCADLMKAILDVPSGASEANIKFQRCLYHVIDSVEVVLTHMKKVLSKQENLVKILTDTPLKPNSFFFPADGQHYASVQLLKLVNDTAAMDIVSRAYQLLTVDNVDAEPKSPEGQRRLRFFANSLFMEMPEAKPVRRMHSFSISTPYFNEIVLYSIKELTAENDDAIKLLYYLQTINPFEWENFLERIHCKDMHEALKKCPEEVQLWASYRGQTLARTVRGMMYNEEAIRFLHWLEIGENEPMHLKACSCNACLQLSEMVALKFTYICTCQIYGKQKDEQRQQATDIDFLLMKHPGLRVAYVDGPKKMKEGPPKYFSCLVRAVGDKITEVYRVELPGDPIIGEGKPENQNHAVIFTRGEWLQCIDMNQDGYLEECLKMPNLLATVDRKEHAKNPLTIIGFREYVFTGGVSNLASFMQIQELSFVSLGQRMLALFHVRQHYGHPDIFDKMFAMTTGGTAKSSRGINLSEDIFAGFNTTLRGGHVSHEEFIQVGKGRDVGMQQLALFEAKLSSGAGECVISRDAMRMANRLDYFRLNSWFYGNLGWYFTQTMTVFGVYFFIYGKIYFALSGMDAFFLQSGGMGISGVLNTSWALQFGFLLVVPVIAVVGVEQGFRHGVTYVLWNCMSLGPIFFTFQMGNRMNYFDRTLIHGGAKYRATGRGFTIKHEKFAELFRFYAFSHFYRGVELAFLLVLYYAYGTFSWCNCSWMLDLTYYNNIQPLANEWNTRCYANYYQSCVLPTNQNYGIMSYSLWLIAATWMWAPFFFNPSGLDWAKVIDDYNDWQHWLQTKNDSSESWLGWWTTELEYLEHSTSFSRFVQIVRKTRFFFVALGIYLQLMYRLFYKDQNKVVATDLAKAGFLEFYKPYMIVGALFVLMLLLVCCGYVSNRITKKMSLKQKRLRKLKFNLSFAVLVLIVVLLLYLSLAALIEIAIIVLLGAYYVLQVNMARLRYNHMIIRTMASGFDRSVGWIVFGPILFIAMFMPFIADFQQRVMFNSAFTSGLEVSKLFSNDAVAPQQAPPPKTKSAKKKKRDE